MLFFYIDLLYFLFGLFVGIFVGLMGVGGGLLMMLIFVLLFGVYFVMVVGIDLLYVVVIKVIGMLVYGLKGLIDWCIIGWFVVGSVLVVVFMLWWLYMYGMNMLGIVWMI